MTDLAANREALRELSQEALLNALERAVERFASVHMERATQELAEATGLPEAMLRFGFDRMMHAHRRSEMERWLREAQEESGCERPAASRVLLHILPGNVPGLAVPAALESLVPEDEDRSDA